VTNIQKPRRPTKEAVELVAMKKQLKKRSQMKSTTPLAVDIEREAPTIESGGNLAPDAVQRLAAQLRPALSLTGM